MQPIDIVLAIAVITVLIGIFLYAHKRKKIHIGKSRVSKKEASSILQIFSADTKFFDFKVREYTEHAIISLQSCIDGRWTKPRPIADFTELETGKYRLIIRRVLTAVDIYLCYESEYDRVVHITSSIPKKRLDALNACEAISQYELSDTKASFGSDKKAPLWVILGSRTNAITASADYCKIPCDSGFAITLHFE